MSLYADLQQFGDVRMDAPLAERTTLGVGGHAAMLFRPRDEEALIQAMLFIPQDTYVFPIGRGSNLLISDKGIDGLVLDLSDLNTLGTAEHTLTAGAGARMGKMAQVAAGAGLTGLEFMATVPGDLGGGVAMNAGAFGQQVSDVLQSVKVLNRNGKVQVLSREELDMRYRYTALPQGALILSATFALAEKDVEAIKQTMRDMRSQRSATQPLDAPNCGSVFKNPEGDFAARLIESVGLKGKQIGRACISDKHANFIVNQGGASCKDVLALIRLAKDMVKAEKGVDLEPEVRLVGCVL